MTKKSATKSPAFQFYPSNFLGSPKVRAMSLAEIGLYTLALCLDWDGVGFTADELRDLAASQREAVDFDAAWGRVRRCFEHDGDRFFNARLKAERQKQREWRRKSSKGGKLGAAKRWAKQDGGGIGVVIPKDDTPSLSLSPTPVTTTPPAKRSNWLTPIGAVWDRHNGAGTFPYPKAAKALKGLRDAGHSPDLIAEHLERYLAKTGKDFVSLHRFAETFGNYGKVTLTGPAVVDGWLSDEVDRLTRPAGMMQ
jgi:uncharacterized protein YdaU (DUF1376 family)